jgi:predicted nucleic acid-binding protein
MDGDRKKLLVIDTAVIIKWLTDEKEDLEKALLVRARFEKRELNILIPMLVHWELSNHLGRNYSPEEAAALYSHFLLLRIPQILPSLSATHLAYKIMKDCPGTSFYDASYHAIALSKEGTFLTSDKKYYEKAKTFGSIKLLKDY